MKGNTWLWAILSLFSVTMALFKAFIGNTEQQQNKDDAKAIANSSDNKALQLVNSPSTATKQSRSVDAVPILGPSLVSQSILELIKPIIESVTGDKKQAQFYIDIYAFCSIVYTKVHEAQRLNESSGVLGIQSIITDQTIITSANELREMYYKTMIKNQQEEEQPQQQLQQQQQHRVLIEEQQVTKNEQTQNATPSVTNHQPDESRDVVADEPTNHKVSAKKQKKKSKKDDVDHSPISHNQVSIQAPVTNVIIPEVLSIATPIEHLPVQETPIAIQPISTEKDQPSAPEPPVAVEAAPMIETADVQVEPVAEKQPETNTENELVQEPKKEELIELVAGYTLQNEITEIPQLETATMPVNTLDNELPTVQEPHHEANTTVANESIESANNTTQVIIEPVVITSFPAPIPAPIPAEPLVVFISRIGTNDKHEITLPDDWEALSAAQRKKVILPHSIKIYDKNSKFVHDVKSDLLHVKNGDTIKVKVALK